MKKLLVGINAKFIHSNLAIRYISAYGAKKGMTIEICEYTINQSIDFIMDEIMVHKPDIIGFSCYLWNIQFVRDLAQMIKQIRPSCQIILGGPEVSYNPKEWMEGYPCIDYIVSGEGEVSTTQLFDYIEQGLSTREILGITYRNNDSIVHNQQGLPMHLGDVPFVYDNNLEDLENRIIYYETSRGCPYSCQYCLSSIEKGVRFRPLDMVLGELQFFLDHQVSQVKFVDRTFNAKKSHAMAIWKYLNEQDNGVTNFHFEITADLLDVPTIDFLGTVRTGLFQFEIGVQSTNEATIVDIERQTDFVMLKNRVMLLMKGNNIHIHLDLIAGLPKENYTAFAKSFNDVMAIRPQQLQLGFLKVLKGSKLFDLQETYGIVSRTFAPYEVLKTTDMTYEELRKLKQIEDLLETYYNSGQFPTSTEYMMGIGASPFDFYEALADYWQNQSLHKTKHHKIQLYDLLYDYGKTVSHVDHEFLKNLLIHDLCLQEKPKKWPEFVGDMSRQSDSLRSFYQSENNVKTIFKAYEGYNSKQISRMAHVQSYGYDIIKWMATGYESPLANPIDIFYDYRQRATMTQKATITQVDLTLTGVMAGEQDD